MINIHFQNKNLSTDIANGAFAFLGLLMIVLSFTKHEAFILPGVVFTAMGIYPFSTSKGILVDKEKKRLYLYKARLWIKSKNEIRIKDYESIQVTNPTRVRPWQSGYMVYELKLLPNPYLKMPKVYLGEFYTKKECMMAAEELSQASALPLVFKIR